MTDQDKAEIIVREKMYKNDAFSRWMDVDIREIGPGHCTLVTEIRPDMLNGFHICHGGVTFSIADSAFAFASNSRGVQSVSIETSISHTRRVYAGDIITAIAEEKTLTTKFGIYDVTLTNQKNETVALFKGTVFRTGKDWEV